jgi:hypothetical protein
MLIRSVSDKGILMSMQKQDLGTTCGAHFLAHGCSVFSEDGVNCNGKVVPVL